jgi:hypothetical protein
MLRWSSLRLPVKAQRAPKTTCNYTTLRKAFGAVLSTTKINATYLSGAFIFAGVLLFLPVDCGYAA